MKEEIVSALTDVELSYLSYRDFEKAIHDLDKKESILHRANKFTTQLFTDLQSTDEETFDESLNLIRSLIAEFSFQRKGKIWAV